MEFVSYAVPGVTLIIPRRIGDDRGYFSEVFRSDRFAEVCGSYQFIQDNESLSRKSGTIRGLHFQSAPHAQGKLVRCTAGALYDVAVDIRAGSPTFGQWVGEILSRENGRQLWVPPGFAHGFCTLEPSTVISYKVTDFYNAECDKGLAWNDPNIGIAWPEIGDSSTLSPKDKQQPTLSQLPKYFAWSA